MKENHTHIVVILDRSGSMSKVCDDTIGGFNTFLEEQKKVPGTATMTLVQFNGTCETTYNDVPLEHIAPLNRLNYVPSGWTALNDALGNTIDMVGLKLASMPEKERPSKVVVVVITDGEENQSRDFAGFNGLAKVKEKVKHQTDKYSWSFSFLGANIDAFSTGVSYGITLANVISYTSNNVGTFNAMKAVSRGVAAERLSSKLTSFFENETNTNAVTDLDMDVSDIGDTIKKYTSNDDNNT